jgi:hypothetical protein
MMRSGRIYGPAIWRRPIKGNESGLWRTPSATDGTGGGMSDKQARYLVDNNMSRSSHSKAQVCLRDQVRNQILFPGFQLSRITLDGNRELFPTPCSQDFKHRGPNSRQKGLSDFVRLWPTPTARDYKDGSKSSCVHIPVKGNLGRAVHVDTILEGQLSATWTEALMGYPKDWTDIDKDCSKENYFPMAWLNGEWENGLQRVIKGQKHRTHRIKALGNSIVPQIPYLIFLSKEFDKWR